MNVEQRRRYLLLAVGIGFVSWLAFRNGTIGRQSILFFVVLIPSVILHEVSHGAWALLFGDDTAKREGRLTLNPLPHVDPVWTLLIPGLLAFSGAPVLGMAKPVPVNVRRLRSPRNHSLIVSLGGPATNLVLSALSIAALRTFGRDMADLTRDLLFSAAIVNVYLAVFNLLPIPPLDGSAVVERFIPDRYLGGYYRIRQYAPIVFLLLFFVGGGLLASIMNPAVNLWFGLLT